MPKLIVCAKQVPDPEAPPGSLKVDTSANKVVLPASISPVVNPYDEQAVEAALRLKDALGGSITVISLGNNLQRDVVKKPLSMGADELILLEDPAFEGGDAWSTVTALAAAIKKVGEFDLVICGRQAADWDAGQVGLGLAEMLGLPVISLAQKVEVMDGRVRVERVIPDGYEVIESSLPALITVSNELGEPRYATLKGIMAASKKQPAVWTPADVGLDASQVGEVGRKSKLVRLFQPTKEAHCEMIEGESVEEAGTLLADRLRTAKVI